jgi:LacI family transcriptional regulator
VRVLSPFSLWGSGETTLFLLEYVAERLRRAGSYRIEYEHRPNLFLRHSPRALERLVTLPDTAAWILFYPTAEMQRWFQQHRVPTVLAGQRHEGVDLPNVSTDVSLLARHAAGLLRRRGHRTMAYVHARVTSLSDHIAASTFLEEAQKLGAAAEIVVHRQDPHDLKREIQSLLARQPRPTAIVVGAPENALAILVHALDSGLKVPSDLSLISMWDDDCLRYVLPDIASYRVDAAAFGAKLAGLVLDVIQGSKSAPCHHTAPSQFVPGLTLGPPLPV